MEGDVYELTFSGNYATGGESLTASTLGINSINGVHVLTGVAVSSDKATALGVAYDHATSKFLFYEGSTAGTALSEKTNAEAYPAGLVVQVAVYGT